MFCIACGTRLPADSVFCHDCGAEIAIAQPPHQGSRAESGPTSTVTAQTMPPRRGPSSGSRTALAAAGLEGGGTKLQSACITYLLLNGLLVVATFLPWERLGVLTASGLELGRGWVILVVALAAAVVAEESLRRGRGVTGLRIAQWASGVAATGMFAIELIVITSACSGQEDQLFDFCIQPGLGVGAVLAGIGGLALGAAATFRHPRLDAQFEASRGPRSIP